MKQNSESTGIKRILAWLGLGFLIICLSPDIAISIVEFLASTTSIPDHILGKSVVTITIFSFAISILDLIITPFYWGAKLLKRIFNHIYIS